MSDLPLFGAIKRYLAEDPARFHTPGHAGRADALAPLSGMLKYDLTEVPELDALYEASGVLLESEKLAAELFSADRTLFSAGGATLCIQTMLGLAAKKGGRVVFSRSLHRSAIHACALLDLAPVFLYPKDRLGGRVDPEELDRILKAQDVDAVYITSPDYYGRLQDIPRIAAICKKQQIPLLVDNAHGTHLMFFGLHPLPQGADMTACSAHKTLPALTGGAFLNINGAAYAKSAKDMMSVFGSTSPSYPVLLSLELCRDWCEREGKTAFKRLESEVRYLKEHAAARGFWFETELTDPVRFCLHTGMAGIDGRKAAKIFRDNGIQPEFAERDNLVLIFTPFHTKEEFSRVKSAVEKLQPQDKGFPEVPFVKTEMVLSVREAVFARNQEIPVQNAAGRVAAQAVCPCPPGIPLLIPGEKIHDGLSEILLKSGIIQVKVVK